MISKALSPVYGRVCMYVCRCVERAEPFGGFGSRRAVGMEERETGGGGCLFGRWPGWRAALFRRGDREGWEITPSTKGQTLTLAGEGGLIAMAMGSRGSGWIGFFFSCEIKKKKKSGEGRGEKVVGGGGLC